MARDCDFIVQMAVNYIWAQFESWIGTTAVCLEGHNCVSTVAS